MTADEQFRAYRALLGKSTDGDVHWWYVGTTMATSDDLPPLPVMQATTLMVYRLETLNRHSFAIHWDEVGYFSDYVTGEVASSWVNPVTGERVEAPKSFAEGPGRYLVTRTDSGLQISLQQPGANVRSVDLQWTAKGKRIQLVQTERKTRGFPERDGKLPAPGSASGFEACTRLAFAGELDPSGTDARDCYGVYDFQLAGMPPWMGFGDWPGKAGVNGVIRKTELGESVHQRAAQTLRDMFPKFFA